MENIKNKLTIGKVANICGIGVETIRYYEKQDLITQPFKTDSHYRYYTQDHIERIQFILNSKELGFSLKEIKNLLELRIDESNSCHDIKPIADSKIKEIEEKIEFLQQLRATLTQLSEDCGSNRNTSPCPILKAIDKGKK